jgi:hypothetical protein
LRWLPQGLPSAAASYFVNTLGYATVSSFMLRASMERVGGAVACYIVLFAGWIYLSRASLKDRGLILPSLYVLFGLALSISSGRVGGGSTYFLDLAAGLSVIVGLMWARGTRALTSPASVRAFAALAALQLALATYGILPGIFTGEMPALSQLGGKTRATLLSDAAIAEAFGSSSGMILCREPAFGIGTNAQNAGPDLYKLNQLMNAGVVSRAVLLEPIREKRFSLVIVPDEERTWRLFHDDVLAAIDSNYELSWAKCGQRFFAPRSGPAASGAVGEQPRTPAGIPDMD